MREAAELLAEQDGLVKIKRDIIEVAGKSLPIALREPVKDVKILKDAKTVEVFLNGGKASYTLWFGK